MCNALRWTIFSADAYQHGALARFATRCASACALVVALCSGVAAAQDTAFEPKPVVSVNVASSDDTLQQVMVFVDFAVVLQIAGDISVIVLGNSEIADASVAAAGTVVLTGKTIGTTNVMVLGPDGDVLSEFYVQVPGHKPGTVTVRRALLPNSYACTASSCHYSGTGPERGTAAN